MRCKNCDNLLSWTEDSKATTIDEYGVQAIVHCKECGTEHYWSFGAGHLYDWSENIIDHSGDYPRNK